MINLKENDRIYYHGDMANVEGFGAVIKIDDSEWGTYIHIKMDDGRKLKPALCGFSEVYLGHSGTRFVTETAYREWKESRIKKWKEYINK